MAGTRLLRISAYVCLTLIVFGCGTSLRAQRCRHDAANERLAKGGRQAADGKVQYTIRFDSNVRSLPVRKAVEGAIALWNAVSHVTNAELKTVPDSTLDADVTIRRTSDNRAHACGSFTTATSVIYYSIREYEDWVDSGFDPKGAAIIMAHELGHFLGLEEENPAMNSIVAQHEGSCRSYGANPRVREPTKKDAEVVRDCIKKHRAAAGKK